MGININIEALLTPVSGDRPCGEDPGGNLTLFSQYTKIQKAALGVPEQVMGDSVRAAVEPDWVSVCALSDEFLQQCKDVRIAVLLVRGMLNRGGYQGLASGLDILVKLLRQYWPNLYPRLIDEENNKEYEVRINAVADLATDVVLRDLYATPMVTARATGTFTYRDYKLSKGESKAPPGDPIPDMAHIRGAFMEANSERLQADRNAISASIASIQAITVCFSHLLPEASVPDLSKLAKELGTLERIFDEFMSQRGIGGAPMQPSEEIEVQRENTVAIPAAIMGEIRNRDDVLRQIEKICQYYQQHEPSSPVPLILSRAKKLASMDFMEIMRDVCPDGIASVRQLAGVVDPGK